MFDELWWSTLTRQEKGNGTPDLRAPFPCASLGTKKVLISLQALIGGDLSGSLTGLAPVHPTHALAKSKETLVHTLASSIRARLMVQNLEEMGAMIALMCSPLRKRKGRQG